MSKFSDYLKARKDELDLSFADISRLTGGKVSKSYLIQMVAEQRPAPKPDKLKALAPALQIPYLKLAEIAGVFEFPDNHEDAICLTDEYRARGLSEADIRKALDIAVAFTKENKKGKKE